MGLQHIKPNEEWWNPPLMTNFILPSVQGRFHCDYQGLIWRHFSPVIFHDYPVEIIKTMFLYLKWVKQNKSGLEFINQNTLNYLHCVLPYLFKVRPKNIRMNRHCYIYPSAALIGAKQNSGNEEFLTAITATEIDLTNLLTQAELHRWLKAATYWSYNLTHDSVNGYGDLRDAIYRITVALNSDDPATLLYLKGWIKDLLQDPRLLF